MVFIDLLFGWLGKLGGVLGEHWDGETISRYDRDVFLCLVLGDASSNAPRQMRYTAFPHSQNMRTEKRPNRKAPIPELKETPHTPTSHPSVH